MTPDFFGCPQVVDVDGTVMGDYVLWGRAWRVRIEGDVAFYECAAAWNGMVVRIEFRVTGALDQVAVIAERWRRRFANCE